MPPFFLGRFSLSGISRSPSVCRCQKGNSGWVTLRGGPKLLEPPPQSGFHLFVANEPVLIQR